MTAEPRRRALLAMIAAALLGGCQKPAAPPAKAASPAKVTPAEGNLNTLSLTPQAVERLGVETATVVSKPWNHRRTLGGEVVIPPGQVFQISAPVTGRLDAPAMGHLPEVGEQIVAGESLFEFQPLLSPDGQPLTPGERVRLAEARAALATSQIEAQRALDAAEVRQAAAEIAVRRAQRLLDDRAGSRRMVDEANEALQLADKELSSAKVRQGFLAQTRLDGDEATLIPQSILAPVSGLVRQVHVTTGMTVAAGTLLVEIAVEHPVWVRVSVYAGDERILAEVKTAEIRTLGSPVTSPGWQAHLATAPGSADPLAATVDLYFVLDDVAGLRPGQKLAVTLPWGAEVPRLMVPAAAVVIDVHGGTWVYVQKAAGEYVRQRVEVLRTTEDVAVLAAGPAQGTRVVSQAAAELFGTEFGMGK